MGLAEDLTELEEMLGHPPEDNGFFARLRKKLRKWFGGKPTILK